MSTCCNTLENFAAPQLSDKDVRIQELEQALKSREMETPNRMVSHAVKNVDRLVSQLLPVAEEEEEEEEEQQQIVGRGAGPHGSTAAGITSRAQAYLNRVQQQQAAAAAAPKPAPAAAPKGAGKPLVQPTQPTQSTEPAGVQPTASMPAPSKAGVLKDVSNTHNAAGGSKEEDAEGKNKGKAGGRKRQPTGVW